MRTQRLAALGLALGLGAATVAAWIGGTAVAQPTGQQGPAYPRMATVDVFAIAEKMMNREELTRPRNELDAQFRTRLETVEQEFERIDTRLRGFQNTNDPQVQPLLQQRQSKAEEYQNLVQQRQQEIERLNASQLSDIYAQIRSVAQRLGRERGYSHVVSNRSEARAMQANTVADALQDMLARPLILAPAEDDLTASVAADLNVDLSAPAPSQPENTQPSAPALPPPPPTNRP